MREQFGTVRSLMACVWHIPGIKIGKENSKEVVRVAVFRAMRERDQTTQYHEIG